MLTLKQIYESAVAKGMKADDRSTDEIKYYLKKQKEAFIKMSKNEKEFFDHEKLTNPYADTRILYGKGSTKVKKIMAGIDIGTGEILLADRLNQKGHKIDLVIAHHPDGSALAALSEVMDIQEHIISKLGVPENIIQKLMAPRIKEVKQGLHPFNHQQVVDAARLLDIPYACMHTVADNQVYQFLKKLMEKHVKKIRTIEDIIKILKTVPEYKIAIKLQAGPEIFAGNKDSKVGKIAVTGMTGGTSGAKGALKAMAQAGVGTILSMHMNDDYKKEADKHHINVLVCGHMASDSLGLNLILDEFEKQNVQIVPTGGFIRVSRVLKK